MCVYLCWHVHQEKSSDGSLSLAVALVRTKQTVSLQDVEEALLPADRGARACVGALISNSEGRRDGGAHPWPPRAENISWKGNCRWRSRSIMSTQVGSPCWLSSSYRISSVPVSHSPAFPTFYEHFLHIWGSTTHLVFPSVLLPFDFPAGEVEPGPAPQRGRDPLLAAFFHLFSAALFVMPLRSLRTKLTQSRYIQPPTFFQVKLFNSHRADFSSFSTV